MRNVIGNKGFVSYRRKIGNLLTVKQPVAFAEETQFSKPVNFSSEVTGADEEGWVDILGPVQPRPIGPTIPALTPLSAPHDAFRMPLFGVGDIWYFQTHIPHGIDASAGIFMHAHV